MSDALLAVPQPPAISVEAVVKRYRLHQKPIYRFLDLFGLCPAGPAYYSEHTALSDVTLSIGRGEKLAIIGRNGAGKSTLLKIVTGLVRPTSGSVRVNGTVSNLLQIGSGFHPDFTGRQNVFASLAHQGITGADAARIFDQVVDFAEIGEYIDQPMKTYSTGMCSRLMFSSSVVTKPEILIVDEILGVGDAYFAHKSFERMRELCADDGTTLLLVTHNIYGALNLCDRFVWLDRGEVKFDGDGKAAISLYESSVKDQEEHYLRQRNVAALAPADEQRIVHLLIRSRTGFALERPLALDRIELHFDDGQTSALPVADGAPGWTLVPEGNLGRPETVAGQPCRVLRNTGSIYHKAEWIVAVSPHSTVTGVGVRYRYEGADQIDVRVFTPDRRLIVAGELTANRLWSKAAFDRNASGARDLEVLNQTDYGTGLVRITSVEFLGRDGNGVADVRHGDPFTVRISLRVVPELTGRDVTFFLGFARHESPYSGYVYEPRITLPAAEECIIDVRLDSVLLGSGQWYVNMGVGELGLYERDAINYFTIDAAWYHMLASRLALRVTSATKVDTYGCFFMHPAAVTVSAAAPAIAAQHTHSS
jgi:ABC-type polysaccharide/polyol phosphate transport system ATPase subunit